MPLDLAAAMGRHLVSSVAGILTIALVARHLGVDGLAAWALLSSGMYFFGLADLGLATAIYRDAAAGDAARSRRTVGLALFTLCGAAPVLALCLAPFAVDLPSASPALQQALLRAAPVAVLAGTLQAAVAPYRAFVLIRGGLAALARARVAAAATQVAALFGLLWWSPSLTAPAAAVCAGVALELVLTARAGRRLDPALPLWPARAHLKGARAALREGAAALVINTSVAAGLRLDVFLLSRFAPLATVAAYGIASRAVEQCLVLAKQTSTALLHRLVEARERDQALTAGTAILGALVASGMPALALDGGPLLAAWAGPAASGGAVALALWLLGGAAVINAAVELPSAAITVGGRSAWDTARIIAFGCALNVALSVAGVPRFGVWAVAGGTVLGNATIAVLIWRRALRSFSWSAGQMGRALLPLGAAGATSLCAGFALRNGAAAGPLASFAACAATTALGCAAAALTVLRSSQAEAEAL